MSRDPEHPTLPSRPPPGGREAESCRPDRHSGCRSVPSWGSFSGSSPLWRIVHVQVNTVDTLQLPELRPALDRLEALLLESAGADDPFLSEVARHLISAGGKRLRPALTVAAALAGRGEVTDRVLLGGVAVELVHLGSLYHDDVMDEAVSRRGVPTVNQRWGNNVAVVAGDFLLARAAAIAARLGTEPAELLADTLADLCQGQVVECQSIFDVSRTEEAYFSAIRGKTAALMATSCRMGAIISGHDSELVDALTRFGMSFGMAFQVLDDVLDVVGDTGNLGKQTGQDLAEGIYTLPVLRALREEVAGEQLRSLLGSSLDDNERARAQAIVAASNGIAEAMAVASDFLSQANKEAGCAERSDVARALCRLGEALSGSLALPAA